MARVTGGTPDAAPVSTVDEDASANAADASAAAAPIQAEQGVEAGATEVASATAPSDTDEATSKRPAMKDLAGVKWRKPGHDQLTLAVTDLLNMGADSPKQELVFNRSNGFTADISELNASTVDALLARPNFTAVSK